MVRTHKEKGCINLIWQCIVPVMVYYVIHNGTALFGISILQLLEGRGILEFAADSFWFYAETFVKMTAMALAGVAVYPYFKKEKGNADLKKVPGKDALLLVVTGGLLSLGMNFLFSVTGFVKVSEQYQQVAEVQFALPLWLGCVFYGILSPVVEEIVFRGISYNALKRFVAEKAAILWSALLFGAFHGNVVQMTYASIMGVVLSLVYQKYQNLLAPILLHGAANVAVYVLTYFF